MTAARLRIRPVLGWAVFGVCGIWAVVGAADGSRNRMPRMAQRRGSIVGGVKARDFAENLPTVQPDDPAWNAARLIATHRLPGLAVVDPDGRPVAVLPASQVLRRVVPSYIQDDPSLARVFDETSADRLCADGLTGKTVRDLLPERRHRVALADVDGDATVIECAAELARLGSSVLVVVDDGQVRGLLTAARLLEVLLPAAGQPAEPDQPASTK